jgi:hypothetical protein
MEKKRPGITEEKASKWERNQRVFVHLASYLL